VLFGSAGAFAIAGTQIIDNADDAQNFEAFQPGLGDFTFG
jgi:hypothetical protein